mgnify:CR=1 FL=1
MEEIRLRIDTLQKTVNQTGQLMEEGLHASKACVDLSQQSKASFEAIVNDLISINAQSTRTSQVIEEQVAVTKGINHHVVCLKHGINETRELSFKSVERSKALTLNLASLQRLVDQFIH